MFADVKAQPDLSRDVFRLMADSEFTFYQAGSYYFECARPDSDWDFYVAYSSEVLDFLTGLGFVTMGTLARAVADGGRLTMDEDHIEYIKDGHGGTRDIMELGDVQVQVLYDVDRMRVTRDRMFEEKAAEHLVADRTKRNTMWCDMYNSVPPSSHAEADAEADALYDASIF